jgi:hypothetical protein
MCGTLGVQFAGKFVADDDVGMRDGDKMLFLDNLARSTERELEDVWHSSDWELPWFVVHRFSKTLASYKSTMGLVDFTDMLQRFVAHGSDVGVKVVVIDEAQDLTPIQWRVVERAFSGAERMYIAGDDDQAIYEWSGADVKRFLHLGEHEREVLPHSYRLPKKIFDVATKLSRRLKQRYEKKFSARDEEGRVARCGSLDQVEWSLPGTWLLLTRNVCFIPLLREACVEQGIPYTWRGGRVSVDPEDVRVILEYERLRKSAKNVTDEKTAEKISEYLSGTKPKLKVGAYPLTGLVSSDPGIWHEAMTGLTADKRAYYVSILRSGRKFTGDSVVHVDTIHGVKGGEADNVVLMTDLTRATEENLHRSPDSETRVFYVGATRARKNLFIVAPTTDRYYSM